MENSILSKFRLIIPETGDEYLTANSPDQAGRQYWEGLYVNLLLEDESLAPDRYSDKVASLSDTGPFSSSSAEIMVYYLPVACRGRSD